MFSRSQFIVSADFSRMSGTAGDGSAGSVWVVIVWGSPLSGFGASCPSATHLTTHVWAGQVLRAHLRDRLLHRVHVIADVAGPVRPPHPRAGAGADLVPVPGACQLLPVDPLIASRSGALVGGVGRRHDSGSPPPRAASSGMVYSPPGSNGSISA